jgi:hypothetical protein
MLAPRELPVKYAVWNHKWGAPFGRPRLGWPLRGTRFDVRRRGPFGFQLNNTTREFEYPWAYEQAVSKGPKLTIVDIGGSLCGLQFVFALEGHTVINVDPGLKAGGLGWDVDINTHRWLSSRFNTTVNIIPESLGNAKIPDKSVDVVLSISSLEHFSEDDLNSTAAVIPKILKDDGRVVMTCDCFLDVCPFTTQLKNQWGTNISICDFLQRGNLSLEKGNRNELVGYSEFKTESVLRNLANYNIGTIYPCMAQCFTATKLRIK